MNDTASAIAASLRRVLEREFRPAAWSDVGNLPWGDPDFSERMLREHLDESHPAASRPREQRALQVDLLWAQLALNEGRVLLDLTCGPGLYAVEMARRGATVTGIDIAPAAIGHATHLAAAAGVDNRCSFVLADVRLAGFGAASFDAAMMLYGQLTVFRPGEMKELLAKVARSLAPGGIFACEVRDASTIDREYRSWWRTAERGVWADGPHLDLGERYFDAEAAAVVQRHHVIDLDTGGLQVVTICDQVYGEEEMEAMLGEAGFDRVECHPAMAGLDLPDASDWTLYTAAVGWDR